MGAACGPISTERSYSETNTTGSVSINADIWADNWFALYVGEQLIKEDSVSITTERSFNAERVIFSEDYPIQLNLIIKDFKQNDSGLEYIGARNQQMGDGGFIMQLTDTDTNKVVAVSDKSFKCEIEVLRIMSHISHCFIWQVFLIIRNKCFVICIDQAVLPHGLVQDTVYGWWCICVNRIDLSIQLCS